MESFRTIMWRCMKRRRRNSDELKKPRTPSDTERVSDDLAPFNSSTVETDINASVTAISCGSLTFKVAYDFIWSYTEELTEVADRTNACQARWDSFWQNNHTNDYVLIRPAGTPLTLQGHKALFESGDVTDFSETVIAIESVKILGRGTVAVLVFKSEQIFRHKGKLTEEKATWTAVLAWEDDRPKITNMQQSMGRCIDSV